VAASSCGTFVAGSLLILGLVAVFSRSLRLYFKIQNAVFFISLISFALITLVWLWRSTSSIMDSLGEGLGQATLRGLGEAAAEAGFAGGGPFSLKWTILAGTCVYINLVLTSRPPTSAAR
jgi:hypothetical protein